MNSLSGKILMIRLLTGLFALVIIFHILIITGIIPFSIVWGGKLESREDMFRFETVSLTVNTLFMIVLLVKKAYLRKGIKNRWVTGAFMAFYGLIYSQYGRKPFCGIPPGEAGVHSAHPPLCNFDILYKQGNKPPYEEIKEGCLLFICLWYR
ncbi:MAG: hypothetical protein LRY55_06505 [Leadbetterella sp.]|nr:hypothetical protein [Leadbetterella sp.]